MTVIDLDKVRALGWVVKYMTKDPSEGAVLLCAVLVETRLCQRFDARADG